ncbi:RNA pyrophosphohydrolase [Kordiimonas sp. SCSIO 12603]|uniref:RNA pyrophosphohydrolase n=1 Tax=Kordiimonas sp. SCSIO 12603 TaxID=2829596 RepID=UPI00210582A3|nr:RNA pyrophosphohydrolase [Kordiimonas sp. SCSIO 12603]UTW59730.1 RNA pyrophosphohydrolase [Kordiimonas sp. SCSIO 12603]
MTDLPYRPCVGVVLLNSEGNIFTAERLDRPGAWQMPQGGVDEGESLEEAALRELEEEISVPASAVKVLSQTSDWIAYDLPPKLIGVAWGGKFRGQKQHWFLLELTGDESLINLETEHPEFTRWKWSSREELISEIVDFKRDVYVKVAEELLS